VETKLGPWIFSLLWAGVEAAVLVSYVGSVAGHDMIWHSVKAAFP
jgi:hypothetical protein